MKALIFVTQFYQLSGAEKLAVELAKRLSGRGYQVELLSMYGRTLPGVKAAEDRLLEQGVDAIDYLGVPISPSILDLLRAVINVRRRLKRGGFDFIETSFVGPMTILCLARLWLSVEIVGGIHAVFERAQHNSLRQRLWRIALRLSNRVKLYAVSKAVEDAWFKYIPFERKRVRVVVNSIEEHFFSEEPDGKGLRRELSIPADQKIILFVGSMLQYKGIDTLVDAVGPILHTVNLHVIFVGESGKHESFSPGEDGFYLKFQSKIKSEMWNGHVSILGNRDDVSRLMASSDLLVHPARTEGFGLVLAEALATGLPIVASNVGGIPEVLDGTESQMVGADDVDALRNAIAGMLEMTEDERLKCVTLGKKRAVRYSVDRRVDELLALAGLPKRLEGFPSGDR